MKKFLFIKIIILSMLFVGCSNDDAPQESTKDNQAKEIAAILNGKFTATVKDLVGTKTYEIAFTPYPTSQKVKFTIPREYVNIDKDAIIYGECEDVEYYNDHLLPTSTKWRYSVNIAYEGAQPKLWFYPIGIYGKYETHDLTIINSTSFTLDGITYTKQ